MKLSRILFILFLSSIAVTACSEDDEDETTEPTPTTNNNGGGGSQNATLPSTVIGQMVNMKFTAPQSGAPYTDQQELKFTFSSSGSLFIDENPNAADGDEISLNTVTKVNTEYVWEDASSGFSYKLSLKSDSSINEVNLFSNSGSTFLGQFIPISSGGGASLIGNYAGTYTVTSVDHGSHNRMTVIIDSIGNIDFDTNTQFSTADYALVSDRLDCCDGIWVDMTPYPTTPNPRINLFIDSASASPSKIEYMPNYPGISGRVHVLF
ncbi:MAG: hypothetical protein RIC95_00065 [Vicingaceae bacterium]